MSRFAADGAGPVAAAKEFKHMVQQMHKAGIEVILDVVYNHTAEGMLLYTACVCQVFVSQSLAALCVSGALL